MSRGAGPFDRAAWVNAFVNTSAEAISDDDIARAASRLGVSAAHIRMIRAVESGGRSFDNSGRPVILFEPHVFYKRTKGKYGRTNFSYPKWGERPYPRGYDARWHQMADAASRDETAALESASWGLFQIMGYHWSTLGYTTVKAFTHAMVESEVGHLEAMLRFIERNGLKGALAQCKAGDPDSCREFARRYNGPGYEKHKYHVKLAEALK